VLLPESAASKVRARRDRAPPAAGAAAGACAARLLAPVGCTATRRLLAGGCLREPAVRPAATSAALLRPPLRRSHPPSAVTAALCFVAQWLPLAARAATYARLCLRGAAGSRGAPCLFASRSLPLRQINEGRVLSVGPGRRDKDGALLPLGAPRPPQSAVRGASRSACAARRVHGRPSFAARVWGAAGEGERHRVRAGAASARLWLTARCRLFLYRDDEILGLLKDE